jgi:hypothetical protein
VKTWFPLALILALSACQEPAPMVEPVAAPTATGEKEQPQASDVSAEKPAAGAITFEGFGPAAFGADQEQVRIAWGRDLEAAPPGAATCYYLMPQPPPAGGYRIAFMIEDGRFARIDVRAVDIVAPGGGNLGMNAEEIEALYPGRVEERPHKYVEGAKYLRIPDAAGGKGVLLFATDADGHVSEWRIGLPPQVDYVEGCS